MIWQDKGFLLSKNKYNENSVIAEILFGPNVAFFGSKVTANLISLLNSLGEQGVAALIIVFAVIFGYLIWDEIPLFKTLIGALLVVVSTLIIFKREIYKKKIITSRPIND